MRLLATADLHYNHRKSREIADGLIDRINALGGFDALLLAGDAAVADGDVLERCLGRFAFEGPKLFVPGNHELWTLGGDSYRLFKTELPERVRAAGWIWLGEEPFRIGNAAVVGSLGWYDYSFAPVEVGIPRRFYERKIAPGSAGQFAEFAGLLERTDDISPAAMEIHARWNDGKFVKLGRSDEAFVEELLGALERQLEAVADAEHVVAAIHHVPFAELLPPAGGAPWNFVKAYLGSPRFGELLLRYANVRTVLCGHSHFPAEAQVGNVHAINLGCGYRSKSYRILDIPINPIAC